MKVKVKRKNKFHAIKNEDGDSRAEAKRYKVLQQMEADGIITDLQKQVKYLLIPAQYGEVDGKRTCLERSTSYIADFVYHKDGKLIVEDVKGYKKGAAYALFTIKRKLLLQIYGIKITET